MIKIAFRADGAATDLLELTVAYGQRPTAVGDHSWLDFSYEPHSPRLGRPVTWGEDPEEWARSLADAYTGSGLTARIVQDDSAAAAAPEPQIPSVSAAGSAEAATDDRAVRGKTFRVGRDGQDLTGWRTGVPPRMWAFALGPLMALGAYLLIASLRKDTSLGLLGLTIAVPCALLIGYLAQQRAVRHAGAWGSATFALSTAMVFGLGPFVAGGLETPAEADRGRAAVAPLSSQAAVQVSRSFASANLAGDLQQACSMAAARDRSTCRRRIRKLKRLRSAERTYKVADTTAKVTSRSARTHPPSAPRRQASVGDLGAAARR